MKKKQFEIYTLSDTFRIMDLGLLSAIMNFQEQFPNQEIIGCIEIDLFHKGATQKPDLE